MRWPKPFNYPLLAVLLPLLLSLLLPAVAVADSWRGHSKYQLQLNRYDHDSLYYQSVGSSAYDQLGELRLQWRDKHGHWQLAADYQLLLRQGDGVELSAQPPVAGLSPQALLNDDRRLLNLTSQLRDHNRSASVHRLDRLYAQYSRDAAVLRVGRQAVSWGNGLIFTVLDFLNPFDPTAIDTEYKTGDDMIYGQYLRANGDDVQALWVARRDSASGHFQQAVTSSAVKYHGFFNTLEYDLLAAQHYDETVLGFALTGDWGGALWRADVSVVDSQVQGQWVASGVAGASYSWQAWGKNMSLVTEYFYNGFGVSGGDYNWQTTSQHRALTQRLARGELYTLARHYLAASLQMELSPLMTISPNVFINLADPSALLQLVARYSLAQDWQLLAALSVPLGPDGSEYGGIAVTTNAMTGAIAEANSDVTLSTQAGAFLQLAWYF